jgi:hypothetical protein
MQNEWQIYYQCLKYSARHPNREKLGSIKEYTKSSYFTLSRKDIN